MKGINLKASTIGVYELYGKFIIQQENININKTNYYSFILNILCYQQHPLKR